MAVSDRPWISEGQEILYDNSTVNFSLPPVKRLDGYHRPPGCHRPIFTYQFTLPLQILQVCDWQHSLPVHSITFQSFFFSKSLHEVHGGGCCSFPSAGHTNFSGHRRLASVGSFRGSSMFPHLYHSGTPLISRHSCKCHKILSHSIKVAAVYRCSSGLCMSNGVSPTRQGATLRDLVRHVQMTVTIMALQVQRLLVLMAAAIVVVPHAKRYMRLLQLWFLWSFQPLSNHQLKCLLTPSHV